MKTIFFVLSITFTAGAQVVVPNQTLDLVKAFEGFRADPYQDSAGFWTQGFGHKDATAPVCMECTTPVTKDQATAMLVNDLNHVLNIIQPHITGALTENQLAAILSFSFNLGPYAFINSTMLKQINAGNSSAAAEQFALWVHAGGQVEPGLVSRREAEQKLFMTPDNEGETDVASN